MRRAFWSVLAVGLALVVAQPAAAQGLERHRRHHVRDRVEDVRDRREHRRHRLEDCLERREARRDRMEVRRDRRHHLRPRQLRRHRPRPA